jgi:hypothetical protein
LAALKSFTGATGSPVLDRPETLRLSVLSCISQRGLKLKVRLIRPIPLESRSPVRETPMRRTVLTVLAAYLAMGLGFAEAQSCSSIVSKICTLANFQPDPNTGYDANRSPICDAANLPTGAQTAAIEAAYEMAPQKVQTDLCGVTRFLIIQNGSASWGRWENPLFHTSVPGDTQIAINSTDLNKTFWAIQDSRLTSLNIDPTFWSHSGSVPGGTDSNAVGLLYVLAHELGHILGQGPTCADDDPNFYSWSNISSSDKTRRWTPFGEDFGTHSDTSIKKPKGSGSNVVQSSDDLKAIYSGGFVTALAAANPEEDFVESYAVNTITDVCPQCKFQIAIPANSSGKINLHDDRGNSMLRSKFKCVHDKNIRPSKF